MLYKPDWDMTKKRFEAFWNREILDRCMVAVTARKDNPATSEYPPEEVSPCCFRSKPWKSLFTGAVFPKNDDVSMQKMC